MSLIHFVSLGGISFHSINIPSEWEFTTASMIQQDPRVTVSIQLISPASGNGRVAERLAYYPGGFHSINIPSEWESRSSSLLRKPTTVSIQLISPASGNFM